MNSRILRALCFFLASSFPTAPADETEDLLRYYEKFDHEKIEQSIKNFLSAKTVEDKQKLVRDPERVAPLMVDHYSKYDYEPEGFERIEAAQITHRERLATLAVQTGEFLVFPITVERTIEEGEETYRVDWESWVGYGGKSPQEMTEKRPADPFLLRATLKLDHYYNYDFSDDTQWQSYLLTVGKTEEVFYAYAPRDSEITKLLFDLENPRRLIVKVSYPPKAKNDRQIIINELVESSGWIPRPKTVAAEKPDTQTTTDPNATGP